MPGSDWLPTREQDLADLCQKWKTGLSDAANVTAFGWKQADVTAALTAVDGFLTARTAYEEDDSSKNRLKKDEAKDAAKSAMRDFANTSLRFNKMMRDVDELLKSDFDTASPFTLKFDESDRGKRLYFCLRWESNTNLKGPYGEIYSAVIP
jgi:hypothetical protein